MSQLIRDAGCDPTFPEFNGPDEFDDEHGEKIEGHNDIYRQNTRYES